MGGSPSGARDRLHNFALGNERVADIEHRLKPTVPAPDLGRAAANHDDLLAVAWFDLEDGAKASKNARGLNGVLVVGKRATW